MRKETTMLTNLRVQKSMFQKVTLILLALSFFQAAIFAQSPVEPNPRIVDTNTGAGKFNAFMIIEAVP